MHSWKRPAAAAAAASLTGLFLALPGTGAAPAAAEPDATSRMDAAVRMAAGFAPEQETVGEVVPLRTDAKGRVVVYVEGADAAALKRAVAGAGGVVSDADTHRVRAAVPPEMLERVAGSPGVREVRRPDVAVPMEIISEGVQPSGALAWHDTGRQGAGVKVGVIDVGFGRLEATQTNGELPVDVTVHNGPCGVEHASSHGTTMAEVVHDMAPRAQLYLACVTDTMSFEAAARWLADQEVDVVNVSLGFPGTGRGDGSPAPAAGDWSPATVVAWLRGLRITVVAAAGNEARTHVTGATADPDGNGWMNISGNAESNGFSMRAGGTTTVELRWDAWPSTNEDLDLYVMDSPHPPSGLNDPDLAERYSVRAQSDTPGGLTPVETVHFTNSESTVRTYWVYVKTNGARQDLRYDLTAYQDAREFAYQEPSGSIAEPATSPYVLAVGAITPDNAAVDGPVERYSSRGPTIDGQLKPDLTGFTDVSTFTGGSPPDATTGTSVASAHVAGAAALYKSANPSLDPAELEALLLDSSSRPGRSDTVGYGILDLGAAREPQPPMGSGFTPEQTIERVLNTGDGTGGKSGPFAAGETFTLRVPGLPDDATAVVLDLFGHNAAGRTQLEVYADTPTGADSMEVLPGRSNHQMVAVTLHPRDKIVRIHNSSAATHLIVDLLGYFSPSGASTYFPKQGPTTLMDTQTWDTPAPKVSDGEEHKVRVRGVAGVPAEATAAVVNVTASAATSRTHIDLYGDNWPNISLVGASPGDRVTKLVLVPLSNDGSIRIRARGGAAHVRLDLVGWFGVGDGARYVPLRYGQRVFDTSTGTQTTHSPFGWGSSRAFQVTGRPRIPYDASAAWFTLRATSQDGTPSAIGTWPREYPWTGHPSLSAQWYDTAAGTGPSVQHNAVLAPLAESGVIGVRNELSTHDIAVVLSGYFVGGQSAGRPEPPAPSGYWKFDEADGVTVADASGNDNAVTLQGGAERIGGRIGRAAWLDGTSGFGATDGPIVRTDQSFSVAAWVYRTGSGATAVAGQDGNESSGFILENLGDRWSFSATSADGGGTTWRAVDANPTRLSEWTHLVGVYDAPTHQLRLYVNGALAGISDNVTLWDAGGALTIGAAKWNGDRAGHFARGIDEVRTYDQALVDSEVKEMHGRTRAVLVGRWTFDEGSGTVADDVTGRPNDGVLHGGAGWTPGVSGSAVNLDGSTGYVETPYRGVRLKDSFTVTAWARLSRTDRFAAVLAQDGGVMDPFFLQYSPTTHRWMLGGMEADTDGAAALPHAASARRAVAGEWTHLAGVYDAGRRQFRLYVNGELSGVAHGVTTWDNHGRFTVGRAKYRGRQVNFFPGAIDDVRTYLGTLTPEEVSALAAG